MHSHLNSLLFLIVFAIGHLQAAETQLEATAFAPQGMVGSVVGVSVDDRGRVFVTQTNRRTYGAVDIRKHMDWVIETFNAQSIEDKRRLLKERFKDGAVGDANADGVVDWQDLTVPSELILMLEDNDQDGEADRKVVFADGFNSEITGLAGSVLAHGDSVYTTIIPSLWQLRDTDDDGTADEGKEAVTGFGLHIGYGGHDMHGLTAGPDGRIYWSIGDKAFSVTDSNGGHHHFPYHGAVLRCEPDGTNFEVFAKGLRNPQELAFDEFGHLFVVDNDGDFGDGERFHYLLEGSDSGWRSYYQYRNNKKLGDVAGYNALSAENLSKPYFYGQAANITPCIANFSEGPAGFTYNPGTALSKALEGHFFLTEFPGKRLQAFRAEPEGAGYRMMAPEVIFGGQMLVGINFGPDGALYAADWGENKWVPHENGRILKLDVPAADRHPLREQTQRRLAADRRRMTEGQLLEWLGDPDQRVRLAAQNEIVQRGDFTILRQTALTDSRTLARIHAIWGCAHLTRTRDGESLQGLASLASHKDPQLREQIIRALGDTRSGYALDLVKRALFDSNPRVRMQAGLALHHLAGPKDIKDITQFIAANGSEDVFRRHAGVQALTGAARDWPELLVDQHNHDSSDVRLAATIGIRRLHEKAEETKTLEDPNEYAGLAKFLEDKDENIVVDAARGIHDVMTPSPIALQTLAEMLNSTKLEREPLLRRSINANRLLGDGASAERLLAFATRTHPRGAMQEEALQLAVTWHRDLLVDRVLGFARVAKTGSPEAMTRALDKHFGKLAEDVSPALIDLVVNSNYRNGIPKVIALSQPDTKDTAIRAQALEALVAINAPGGEASMSEAAKSQETRLRQVAHRYLAQQAPKSPDTLRFLKEAIQQQDLREAQQAYALLGEINAISILRREAAQLAEGKRRPEVQLDLIEAIQACNDSEALSLIEGVEATLIAGGDRTTGRGIFQTNIVAQCIRCHEFKGKGGQIGPDLTEVAKRLSPEKLLESLIAPQADISEGYGLVSLVLNDGSAHAGTLVEQSDREYTLKDPTGNINMIALDQVETITPAMSSMPPMGAILSKRELRDLMAYMVTLR